MRDLSHTDVPVGHFIPLQFPVSCGPKPRNKTLIAERAGQTRMNTLKRAMGLEPTTLSLGS